MADVITRFKLETTQFDSKLRDTSKALRDIAHQAELGGKDFDKFSDEAIKSARALGTVQSGATNTKDKLRDLVGSYNDAAKAYNSLTDTAKKGEFGQAMSQSLTQLQQRIKETKEDLYSLGDGMKGASGGSLFSSDKLSGMLQVFGGNVMTKVAGMGVGFVSELGDMVKQGIELARAGEGIRIAFERLNKPGLLDNLREATHGTVTDLELMKAAVKFNDFKLPVEELGTMLAFAQQKAKDTGQSVDYMVDSIVTGLGRKSLMILDNLGLSAAEIKEKMKDTGDMTKAVGEIIREQMAKAGDYVETAADRATKANVELENAMTRLGETFQPLTDAANSMWNDIKVGALDLLNSAIRPLINAFTEAGRARALYESQGGDARVNRQLDRLKGIQSDSYRQGTYKAQLRNYDTQIASHEQYLKDYKAWQRDNTNVGAYNRMQAFQQQTGLQWVSDVKAHLDAFKKMRAEYVQGAKTILSPVKANIDTADAEQNVASLTKKLKELQEQRKKAIAAGDTELSKNLLKQINQTKADIKGLGGSVTTKTSTGKTLEEKIAWDPNKANLAATKAIDTMPSVWAMMGGDEGLRQMMGIGRKQFDLGRDITEKDYKKLPGYKDDKETKKLTEKISTLSSGLSSIAGGLKSMGIDLPKEVDQVIGVIQGVTSVIEGVNSIISIFSTSAMAANTAAIVANTAALIANSTTNLIPLAGGGIVPHAAGGYLIGGNNYSGDKIFAGHAWVNSGELVLNRAQQGNLASQLEGGGMGAMQLSAVITGEQLRLVLNNNGRRTGRGEYVTTNFR